MTEVASGSPQTISTRQLVRCVCSKMKSLRIQLPLLITLAFGSSLRADEKPGVIGIDPLDVEVAGQRDLVLHFPWKFRFPDIVRFRELPHRMLNEPFLERADVVAEVPDRFVETWIRCFKDEPDLEIRIVAAEHLARVARAKNVDLTSIAANLIETLQSTSSRRLQWGCLMVLRDGNLKQSADVLTKLAASGDDDLRRLIDPVLVKWQYKPAIDVWMARVQDPNSSNTSRLLACQSLAAVKATQATEPISKFITDAAESFQLRSESAKAVNYLQPTTARNIAGQLLDGSRLEKLLAIRLLNHAHIDAIDTVYPLCNDSDPAVSVAAWETLETHDAERLLPLLGQGIVNTESGIRACCTRLTSRFPTLERIQLISPMLGDNHLGVRNACRQALTLVGEEQPDLQQPIVDLIAPQLSNPKASWQAIEQTCYVLAKLRRPEFAEDCLQLCRHERPEVFVAAAWLFHLMPEPKFKTEFRALLDERLKIATSTLEANRRIFQELDQQVGLLFQAAGYCGFTEELQHMTDQISKESGLSEQGRSAGIWGIGALNAGSKDESATKALVGRLVDRVHPVMPEFDIVRRMAAQGLGRVGSESAITHLKTAFEIDGTHTFIPQTARWSLQMLEQPSPGPIPETPASVGSWKLLPLDR